MKLRPYIFAVALLALAGCKKTKACLEEESYLVEVGETLRINSCSENGTVYTWEIDGRNLHTASFIGADEYTVESGGTHCDDFVVLSFEEAGDYELSLNVAKLKDGSCESGNFESSLSKEVTAEISVVE